MKYPPVVIVNERDEVVGEAMLDEARAKGLIYRIVFVICKGRDGRIILQKRTANMQVYPNCWDISASGHVDDGHSYERAALLELEEELGVRGVTIIDRAHFYTDEPLWGGIASKRFVRIYETALDTFPEQFGKDEVTQVGWFAKDEIHRLVQDHPDNVAEGLRYSLPYILEK